ncbi:hypothetical protein ILUMI_23458 [Ignelater luminosus]|uniref:Uncharacterized protein n=1 Tax=Ignelater luminosus TaxID=2038154 RepID=A0A8K0C832_IGNLU|nr:hypothetical protein ILUMI_23458 [Ignelater luminosus]
MKYLRNTTEEIEKSRKKNNVVINELKIDARETKVLKETMKTFVKKHLNIDVEIKIAAKLGDKTGLVQLKNENDKTTLMQNKAKLRHIKTERVFINDGQTKKEREKPRQLRLMAKTEREKVKRLRVQ